jgi:lysophospholipase L1-like esterase
VLRNLALAVLATLVALLCAELLYRGYEAAFPLPAPATSAAMLDPEMVALPELTTAPQLARPNQRGRAMNVLWRTNGSGMRGPDFAPRPDEGTFRIALLGDSFAAGVGVREEEIYASRVARMLAEAGAGRNLELMNFALPGLNAAGVLGHSRRLANRFHPQLFVYGFTLNDLFEPGEEDIPGAPVDFASLQLLAERVRGLHSHLLPALVTRLVGISATIWPGPYPKLVLRSYADPQMQARLARSMAALAALADDFDACAHVFVHTDLTALRFGHPFSEIYEQVADAARAAGLSASTSYPAFRGRDSTWLRLSFLDGHPNAEGHRILAGALYDALRELPPRCGLPPLPARGEE